MSKQSKKKSQPPISNTEIRRTLAEDVAAYLAAGNSIEQVPSGISGQDQSASRRQITLGNKKN